MYPPSTYISYYQSYLLTLFLESLRSQGSEMGGLLVNQMTPFVAKERSC